MSKCGCVYIFVFSSVCPCMRVFRMCEKLSIQRHYLDVILDSTKQTKDYTKHSMNINNNSLWEKARHVILSCVHRRHLLFNSIDYKLHDMHFIHGINLKGIQKCRYSNLSFLTLDRSVLIHRSITDFDNSHFIFSSFSMHVIYLHSSKVKR